MALQPVMIAAMAATLGSSAAPAYDPVTPPANRVYLVGKGLIVGLNGTGDTLGKGPFTRQMLKALSLKAGAPDVDPRDETRGVAAVAVVAVVQSNAPGGAVDLNISALGDAASIKGGTLLVTPLTGPDGQVYAIGSGTVSQACGLGVAGPRMGCILLGATVSRRAGIDVSPR